MLKKNKLRYNEYYDMQHIYDELYAQSKNGNNFYKLLEIIGSEQNICLAYRNLKSNSGSKTAGTDGMTIDDIKQLSNAEIVATVRESLSNYRPKSVRRVFIPKAGSDKMRPLGIPCIWDRLVQQCILQVLEPICEPKFHNHSYGFRANRSAHHAVSRVTTLINLSKYHYCVDVDIKGFFDNVNHGKLLKQIWTLGIRDKRLICIISKMLKAEIDGEGVPEKGTPQGGLLSPLLSLIVLNELDWWVSSQWETFQPKNRSKNGWFQYAKKYTKLKSGFIVRYADDFKIMCSTYGEAQRFYHSTVDFLNKRLKLEISPEKSKVVNLKKNSSDFLGFKIKVIPKGRTKHGYVAKTDMNQKALKKAKTNLKLKVKDIARHTTGFNISRYNLTVIGMQNYYCIATNVYNNLTEVSYALLPTIRIRLRNIAKSVPFESTSSEFQSKTKGIRPKTKIVMIADNPLLPIQGVQHKNPMNFSQDICNFTSICLYIAFILISAVGTILAVQSLSDATKYKYRYQTLRRLGVNDKSLFKTIKKQLLILFGIPVVYSVIASFCMLASLNNVYNVLLANEFIYLFYFAGGLAIFFFIYGIYWIATYIGFKRNINEES